jgi:hypothetical protein
MVALVAMAWEGTSDGSGKTGSANGRSTTDTGSVACLVRRGNWCVRVASVEGGISSVVEDASGLAGNKACNRWCWVRMVIQWRGEE